MGVRSTGNHPTTTQADGHLLEYFRQTFGAGGAGTNAPPGVGGLTATGGAISDYASGSDVYRAHIFTSSGTFNVSAIGGFGSTVDFLVVGGGGGAGISYGGGGGAGGFRSSVVAPGGPGTSAESALTVSAQSYTVTVGGSLMECQRTRNIQRLCM